MQAQCSAVSGTLCLTTSPKAQGDITEGEERFQEREAREGGKNCLLGWCTHKHSHSGQWLWLSATHRADQHCGRGSQGLEYQRGSDSFPQACGLCSSAQPYKYTHVYAGGIDRNQRDIKEKRKGRGRSGSSSGDKWGKYDENLLHACMRFSMNKKYITSCERLHY